MANISTDNINTLAQLAASLSDGDYFYIYKASSGAFSRVEKSVVVQALSSFVSIDESIYGNIKDNADLLQAKVDELTDAVNSIVAYAFDGNKPNISEIGPLDWIDQDAPQEITPTLVVSSSTLNFSTTAGTSVQKTFTVKGRNLTGNINLAITYGQGFSINPAIISSDLDGTHTIKVVYNPSEAGTNSATINISSAGASTKQVTLNGTATDAEVPADTANLTINLTGNNVTSNKEGGTVELGSPLSIQLGTNDNLYVVDGVRVTMNGANITSQVYNESTDVISINNVTGDVVVSATAITYVSDGLEMMLDGKNQGDIATEWANLAKPLYPLALSGTGFTKNTDHIAFAGGESGTSDFATGEMDDFGFNSAYTESTAEAVYSQITALSSQTSANAILVTGRSNGTLIGITTKDNNRVLFARVAGEYAPDVSTACGILTNYNANQIVSVSHAGTAYFLNKNLLSTGGAIALTIGESGSDYNMAGHIAVGGFTSRANAYIFPFAGNIYCLRLYSKALTQSEVEQNFKVDKKRFNIS